MSHMTCLIIHVDGLINCHVVGWRKSLYDLKELLLQDSRLVRVQIQYDNLN